MGKMKDALVKLAKKTTGKEVQDENSISNVVNFMAENYQGGGGITLVDTLPEVGDEGLLYKTPDGKIWSCTNTTEEVVVSDLQVGNSYKLNSEIKFEDLKKFVNTFTANTWPFNEEGNESISSLIEEGETNKFIIGYYILSETTQKAEFRAVFDYSQENVQIRLDGFDTIPSITINEFFANFIEEEGQNLSDFAFLFEGGSHTEEVLISTWTEVGSGSGGGTKYLHTIYGYANYNCTDDIATFTFFSDSSTPITLEQLFDYLDTNKDIQITTYGIDINNTYSITEYVLGYSEDAEQVSWGDRGLDGITNFVDIVSLNLDL